MQDPQPATPANNEALSWQFIVLALFMALLVPLVTTIPVEIERGAPRVVADTSSTATTDSTDTTDPAANPADTAASTASLTDLELDTTYETSAGVGVTYPADWTITEPSDGAFILTNYAEGAGRTPSAANELAIVGQVIPTEVLLANWQLEYETVPAPVEILGAQAEAAGIDPANLTEITIDGYPAAQTFFTDQGDEVVVILAAPNTDQMVFIQAIALANQSEAVHAAVSQILEGMTLDLTAG
jgi:hypothetical protein